MTLMMLNMMTIFPRRDKDDNNYVEYDDNFSQEG